MLMPSHMAILAMLVAQGRGDLLDYVPSDAYWQAKHATVTVESLMADLKPRGEKVDISSELQQLGSDQFAVREAARQKIEAAGAAALSQLKEAQTSTEPEIARVAKELSAKYAGKDKAQAVRQLMAIRTLGERKEKAALPALAELEQSKDAFVAEYAHRAALQIEGKPIAVTVDATKADADVWLLPKNTGILLQEKATATTGLTLARIAENCPEMLFAQMGYSKEKLIQEATEGIINVTEQVGDVRFEGLTVAIADDVGSNSGWVVFIGRGKFDGDALGTVLENSPAFLPAGQLKKSIQGNLKIYEDGRNLDLILSGDDRLVILAGPGQDQIAPTKDAMIKALQTGKGELGDSQEMAKVIKQADRTALVWGVAGKVSPEVKTELQKGMPAFAALDTAVVSAVIKDEAIHFVLEAVGSDKQAISGGVDSFNAMIAQTLGSVKQVPAGAAVSVTMKPIIEIMESLKATANEQKATLIGDVKVNTLGMGLGAMFFALSREDAQMLQVAPAANGAIAVPAPAGP